MLEDNKSRSQEVESSLPQSFETLKVVLIDLTQELKQMRGEIKTLTTEVVQLRTVVNARQPLAEVQEEHSEPRAEVQSIAQEIIPQQDVVTDNVLSYHNTESDDGRLRTVDKGEPSPDIPSVPVEQPRVAYKREEIIKQSDHRDETDQLEKQVAELEAQLEEQRTRLDESEKAMKKGKTKMDCLTKADIQELRVGQNPPAAVKQTLSALMVLLNLSEEWKDIMKALKEPRFIEQLQRFDLTKVTPKMLKRVNGDINEHDLQFDSVARKSAAAAGILKWITACIACVSIQKEEKKIKMIIAAISDQQAHVSQELRKGTNADLK